MHCGYVVKVEKLRKHENADRLQIATFFGNDTCVGLDVVMGEIGIYFPSDLQLSEEFCEINHLCRKKKDGSSDTGYLDENKRNIKAINLRGEKSDGIFCPLSSIVYTGINLDDLNIGDTISILNNHEICKKYIPQRQHRHGEYSTGNKTRKHKVSIAPLFMEHADTEQLAYNLSAFKPGDEIEITLKMHGTSQRTGYLPVLKGYHDSWHCQIRNWLWFQFNRITKKNDLHTTIDKMKHDGKPYYDYGYVSGTRRVVLDNYEGGFYGSNTFREQHSKFFEGKLWKGETVYYEVVSFTDDGTPIMGKGKVPKEAQSQYGTEMVFHYGRSEGSDIYVYRMTMTNEDGDVVEYTPDFMRYRCEQMGAKTVPVLWRGTIPYTMDDIESPIPGHRIVLKEGESAGEWIKKVAEQYYDGPDPIGKTHVREGVVVRILNRPKFCAYKHKNHLFKMISGIIAETVADTNVEISEDILTEL